ncbi:MAG: phosphonate metabolism transcriptional regulator PhnF [Pseudomonadota bacterium]
MVRDRWRDIREAIEQDIMDGVLETGSKLPTEPELVAQYGVGRHSVRRAVTELAKAGHLSVEQGRGTFVQARPLLKYTIGQRTRMRQTMGAQGVDVASSSLGVERLAATARIAVALQVALGTEVIATSRLSLADGVPVSFGTLYHDAARFPHFPERRQAMGSVSAVYASYGIEDYLRASTQVHARPARVEEAKRLRQHPEMPVMVVRAVDAALDGTPIAYSQVIWSAARVKFDISTGQTSPSTEKGPGS